MQHRKWKTISNKVRLKAKAEERGNAPQWIGQKSLFATLGCQKEL